MTVTDRSEAEPPTPGPPGTPVAPAPDRARRGVAGIAGRRRRHAVPSAPAARFEPGRVAEPRRRNPTWIVAGVLLVVLSALGGVLLFTSSDDRTGVLVAASDLEPGRAVEAADLRIERVAIDGGVRAVTADDAGELVGRHPTGRIPAGTMLSPAMFDAAIPLGPDEVVIGASLDPGEAPLSAVDVGDAVELIEVDVAAPGDAAATESSVRTLGTGTVWAVEPVATGQLWLSVRADRAVGMAASLASAQDRLRVALIGGGG